MEPHEMARKKASGKWRSRLCERGADIFRWRRAGMSFRDIADRIKREGLDVSHSAVASFVRARLPKPESPRKAPPCPLVPSAPPPTKPGRLVLPLIVPAKRPEPEAPAPKKPFLDLSKIPEHLRPVSNGDI